ncbi:MAG: CSLREA domain-containing protein, partial [Chloroflexi bacterium]|nr:CSLREA domain-containing protein [Chloroflexota bacterium]
MSRVVGIAGWRIAGLGLAALALLAAVWLSVDLSSAGPPEIVVDSVGDAADPAPGDGICDDGAGNCTLRAAIQTANALPGGDSVFFDIPG